MTPEELNRTVEFIVESQARLATVQERSEEWMTRLARLQQTQSELLVHQSNRLDWLESFNERSLKHSDAVQRQIEDFKKQTLHLLHMILYRLPPAGGA
jgi:hypothetical protein